MISEEPSTFAIRTSSSLRPTRLAELMVPGLDAGHVVTLKGVGGPPARTAAKACALVAPVLVQDPAGALTPWVEPVKSTDRAGRSAKSFDGVPFELKLERIEHQMPPGSIGIAELDEVGGGPGRLWTFG